MRKLQTNLLVEGYEVENDGVTKLYCVAYSPKKLQIYLSDNYYNYWWNEDNADCVLYKFKFYLGNNKLNWIKVDRTKFPLSCVADYYNFIIILENPKNVENISMYDGSVAIKHVGIRGNTNYSYQFNDVININGLFKLSDNSNKVFVFENCNFTNEIIKYNDTMVDDTEVINQTAEEINITAKHIRDSLALAESKDNNQFDSSHILQDSSNKHTIIKNTDTLP